MRQAFREPRMRVMLFLPPVIQLLVFGYAVNLDVDNARIAWMDQDHTPASRELLARFQGSGRFTVVATPADDAAMRHLFDTGKIEGAVGILPGFARDVTRGRDTAVQVLIDGTNSNTASIVSNYASQIISSYSSAAAEAFSRERIAASGAQTAVQPAIPSLNVATRVWFNEDLRSRNYFVPGVLCNIITLVTLMLTAMAIVREKEIGTMEQLMVTPVRPMELMIGKMLPFALVGLMDMVLVTVVSLLLFRVPFRGNFLFLVACAGLFLLNTLAMGLFISTISRTQQQAMLSTFLFYQPFFLLSGFSFPVRNMPQVAQYLTILNPVRYFLEIVRGVFLKGSGASVLWPQMTTLAVFGVLIMTLSAMRFHKKLE